MFDRPGEKLKALALIDFIIMIIASFILAIVFGKTVTRYDSEFSLWKFLLILSSGCITAYITSISLYAFGELVDSTERNADATYEILNKFKKENSNHVTQDSNAVIPSNFKMSTCPEEKALEYWICPRCKTRTSTAKDICKYCGRPRQ